MAASIMTLTGRHRSGDLRGTDDDGVDGLLAEVRAAELGGVTEESLFA